MSKVVAIMSMSLDGYVADLNDGVAEVFDWYLNSGDVEIHTGGADPMTFKVSAPSAERRALSRAHVRTWCRAHRPTHLRRRPRLGRKPRLGTGIRAYPPRPRRMAATQLDCTLRDGRHRKRREPSQNRRRREVRWRPRRRYHPAIAECWAPRRNPCRHRGGSAWLRSSTLRPPRQHASRPRQPDGDPGRRRYTPALSSTQGVVGPHTLSRPAVSFSSVRRSHARAPTTSSTSSAPRV